MPAPQPGETVITTDELKAWLRSGRVLARLLSWREARLLTDRVHTLGRPLPTAVALRLLSRGDCYAVDGDGGQRPLSAALLARWTARAVVEPFLRPGLLRRAAAEVAQLEAAAAPGPQSVRLNRNGRPLYVRADVSFGVRAGGSVGHTAGVVNHLQEVAGPPIVLTTDRLPTIRSGIETHDVEPDEMFWSFRELPALVMNRAVRRAAARVLQDQPLAFLYQRYTLNGYASVAVAREYGVPLVTEYNGSEVWVARNWGHPLRYEPLSQRIERLNLRAAHLVSVVSRPLADEVRAAGVEPRRILVNPNGVDPERYRPDVDGSRVRARYGLDGKIVIGFIGTFGPWHGAEVLAQAFSRLLARVELRDTVRLLWIGDGVGLPRVQEIVAAGGVASSCVFTGLVPQANGPEHLAACDILVSPHVRNADGTPFFGSPTKLFEYMAMGRGIVASALDQIADVLEHDRTALLVPPGDVAALVQALERLVSDQPLRECLGRNARALVVERYTWLQHTRRTMQALADVVETHPANGGEL